MKYFKFKNDYAAKPADVYYSLKVPEISIIVYDIRMSLLVRFCYDPSAKY